MRTPLVRRLDAGAKCEKVLSVLQRINRQKRRVSHQCGVCRGHRARARRAHSLLPHFRISFARGLSPWPPAPDARGERVTAAGGLDGAVASAETPRGAGGGAATFSCSFTSFARSIALVGSLTPSLSAPHLLPPAEEARPRGAPRAPFFAGGGAHARGVGSRRHKGGATKAWESTPSTRLAARLGRPCCRCCRFDMSASPFGGGGGGARRPRPSVLANESRKPHISSTSCSALEVGAFIAFSTAACAALAAASALAASESLESSFFPLLFLLLPSSPPSSQP